MSPTMTVQIAWGDCDEQGIVHYPNYFYWMDSAFQALLRKAGLSLRAIRENFGAIGIPLVEANARFHASATHEDALAIQAQVSHWGRTSFRVSYTAFRAKEIVFEGFRKNSAPRSPRQARPRGPHADGPFLRQARIFTAGRYHETRMRTDRTGPARA